MNANEISNYVLHETDKIIDVLETNRIRFRRLLDEAIEYGNREDIAEYASFEAKLSSAILALRGVNRIFD